MFNKQIWIVLVVLAGSIISCDDDDSPVNSNSNPFQPLALDTTGVLKDAASFPVGVGIDYELFSQNSTYASIVQREFSEVTAEFQMKQGAIVQDNGTFDFSTVDNLVQQTSDAGMQIHGHTLIWHQNNNGNFLRSLVFGEGETTGGGGETDPKMFLIENGSFENGLTGWAVFNNTECSFSTTTDEAHLGSTSLMVESTAPQDEPWNCQLVSPEFDVPVEVGQDYQITLWLKGVSSGPAGRLSTREQPSFQGGEDAMQATPAWSQVVWTLTAQVDGTQQLALDMGTSDINTYFVDEVEVKPLDTGGDTGGASAEDSTKVADFMKEYITTMVSRYSDDNVVSWDVVNEPIEDGTGALRTNPSPGTPTQGDTFFWAEFVGEDYIPLAFQWADQADPEADLYLNDFNLSIDDTKREAFINLVNEMLANGVPIDGVGTQMHINVNTPFVDIDRMFEDLAETGLKVKITELDVRINPNNSNPEVSDRLLALQQIMYNYVAWSYIENVPEEQRAGVTVWNLIDNNSWIVTALGDQDYPTLFDSTFTKKPAYGGFRRGLMGVKPNARPGESE